MAGNEHSNSRYKMFRNFLYNELKITKEDIMEWTKETVKEVVEARVNQIVDIDKIARSVANNISYNTVDNAIKKAVRDQVIDNFDFTVVIDNKK